MKLPRETGGANAPPMGLRPIPRGGCAPCAPPENLSEKEWLEDVAASRWSGPEYTRHAGALSRARVTFSFDPAETRLGYIVK